MIQASGRVIGLLFGSILVLALPGRAHAFWPGAPGATSPLTPGQLYVGFGVSAGVYSLPRFDSPWRSAQLNGGSAGDENRPSFAGNPAVGAPGGVFGYVFRNGAFPKWAGSKVRIALGGQYWSGRDVETERRAPGSFVGLPAVFYSAAPIDGTAGTNIGLVGNPLARRARYELNADGYELSLRLASDFDVRRHVTLSPFVVLFGGRSREAYEVQARIPTSGGFDFGIYSLDEKVTTVRAGALAGLGAVYRVSRDVSVHVAAQAGFVWLRSRLSGNDCFSGAAPGAPNGALCENSVVTGGFQTGVSDTRTSLGFRGGLMAGVSWNLGFAVLSFTGYMTYDNRVPGVRNPAVTSAFTALGNRDQPTSGRAHLYFDDAFRYGGMMMLRIMLNAPGG